MSGRDRIWLVLPDVLSTRVFVDTGIVALLTAALGDRLVTIPLDLDRALPLWGDGLPGYLDPRELLPADVSLTEKVKRRVDRDLDRRLGFFPLAIRLNRRCGFHAERMEPDHPNRFLDPSLAGPFPRSDRVEAAMRRWYFSSRRYVPSALRRRLEADCRTLVVSNIQTPGAATFLTAAQRLRIPTVGYLASWDHTVGKGVVWPGLARYIVQNEVMRDDLVRYHGIGSDVAVTGWPQSDVFAAPQPFERYAALLGGLGVDPALPTVLVTGNTPTNAPYEGRFVERLVAWWKEHGRGRLGLVFRPHPRDSAWRERYAAAVATAGVGTQAPSYTDLDDLATLLQHVAVVVTNAGTILLDAVTNDRPVICVVYDEGAPAGEQWAAKNILGEHYRQLLASDAFPLAHGFDDVVAGIEDALHDPQARSEARRRVTHEVLGDVDGHAAQRVVDAILSAVE